MYPIKLSPELSWESFWSYFYFVPGIKIYINPQRRGHHIRGVSEFGALCHEVYKASDPLEPGISSDCKPPKAVKTSGFPCPGSDDRNTGTFQKAEIRTQSSTLKQCALPLFRVSLHRSGGQSLMLCTGLSTVLGFCLFVYVNVYLRILLQSLYLHCLKLKTLKIYSIVLYYYQREAIVIVFQTDSGKVIDLLNTY